MAAVLIERSEKAAAQGFGHSVRTEVPKPDPGKRAESDFESAGPIDAVLEGVLFEPGFEFGEDFVEEFGFASEEVGLGQEDKVLVTAEFPDEFVIADGGEA